MIPFDHITFDGDTAWWVPSDLFGPTPGIDIKRLDRPCDTCDGCKHLCTDGVNAIPCPDCIDGRHTFEIKVGPMYCEHGRFTKRHRVSIVPGMVLPIYGPHMQRGEVVKFISTRKGGPWLNDRGQPPRPVTLPPAAKPGMWAVQLKVEQ